MVLVVPEAAAGARLLAATSGAADCATAGADMASEAATTHDAHEAKNIPLDESVDLNRDRNADVSDVSGERDTRGVRKSGNCDKRETKRESRRLRDKEVGNVVIGQRNMPEILSPCG
ncbi:MAG: hypothetical protein ACN6OQ_18735 [Paraburkholderia nemoris]|jgi:hypothetical protein|uniref:hypothetical protein n=2 Tax=Paraburkholderia nemoris TaxID=2793076 RepID=UPI001F43DB94|nr:hypothetical protein [Paraburkholderia nemoris]